MGKYPSKCDSHNLLIVMLNHINHYRNIDVSLCIISHSCLQISSGLYFNLYAAFHAYISTYFTE